jgi:hypothetical protein
MSDKSRFLNFPIVMLAKTIAEPKAGLNAIADYSIATFSAHCARDFESAFAQLAYVARAKIGSMPAAVRAFLDRQDVADLVEAIHETAWGTENYTAAAADLLHDLLPENAISEQERQAVISFIALHDAAAFFGRGVADYDGLALSAQRSRQAVQDHEAAHGKSVFASVPAAYFFETFDGNPTKDDLRVFRCVAAVRSLNGKKNFVGVTKAMIAARMCGGKSPAVAASLAQGTPELKAELDALQSRKRIDRVLTLGAVRGFYGKVGLGRRVYVSTSAKDPDVLADMVSRRFTALGKYQAQERQARRRYQKGQQEGQQEGQQGDIIGYSFNKTL